MGVLEVVLSAVVCAVVIVSVARIAAKAGFSPWWALVPTATTGVAFATLATVHSHARFGALSLHTIVHSARALAIADAACLGATVLLLVVFAVSDWPALTVAPATPATAMATATAMSKAHRRGRASGRAQAAEEVPARMRIRALPDVEGQPAGWYASGALGSGEQSYWDGTKWTARRCWRNEMWINQPVEPSLLAEAMR
ncbi:MAG TPA: hypothetical protein VGF51_02420 [Acidimicrobiales bacterium]